MEAGVIIFERDITFCDVLAEALCDGGYEVLAEVDLKDAALQILHHQFPGAVVVVSNAFADHHLTAALFAGVSADTELCSRHRYILLSTNPHALPPALAADVSRVHATILPKPMDLDAFLQAVKHATKSLAPVKRQGTYSDKGRLTLPRLAALPM